MDFGIGTSSNDHAEDTPSTPAAPRLARKRTTYGKQIHRQATYSHLGHRSVQHTPSQRLSEDKNHPDSAFKRSAVARPRDTFDVPSSEDEVSSPVVKKPGSVKRSYLEFDTGTVVSNTGKKSGLQRPKKLVKAGTNAAPAGNGPATSDVFQSGDDDIDPNPNLGRPRSNQPSRLRKKNSTTVYDEPQYFSNESFRPVQDALELERLSLERSKGVSWQPTADRLSPNISTGTKRKVQEKQRAVDVLRAVQSKNAQPDMKRSELEEGPRVGTMEHQQAGLSSNYRWNVSSVPPMISEERNLSGATLPGTEHCEISEYLSNSTDARVQEVLAKSTLNGSEAGNEFDRNCSEESNDRALQIPKELPRRQKLKDRLIPTAPASSQSLSSDDDDKYDDSLEDVQSVTSGRESGSGRDKTCSPKVHKPYPGMAATNLSQTPGKGKVTYGRQRSHLAEQATDVDFAWDDPLVDIGDSSGMPRRKLGNPIQNKEDESQQANPLSDSDDGAQENALRSVHELRAAGKMRRAALETDALLDDIGTASTMSLKRSSVLRLAHKLLDKDFRDAFVRNGLHVRFYKIIGTNTDQFIVVAFCMTAIHLFDAIPAFDLAPGKAANSIFDAAIFVLQQDQPILSMAKARTANMSRMHQQDLQRLLVTYNNQSNDPYGDVSGLSAQFFGLKCLERGIRHLTQSGYSGTIISSSVISTLSNIAAQPFSEYATPSVKGHTQDLALSILEYLSIAQLNSDEIASDLPQSVLDDILAAALSRISMDQKSLLPRSNVALRLCLNLTTDSQQNCEYFASAKVVMEVTALIQSNFNNVMSSSQDSDQDALIDNLVLSLGFLTNLSEKSAAIPKVFLDSVVDGSSCIQRLIEIFQSCWEGVSTATTESESKINVTFGYLAVLLCSLCIDSKIRSQVAVILDDATLSKVREAMAQFILFHRTILRSGDNEHETGNQGQAVFLGRMEELLRVLTLQAR